ncbi:MAG: RNA polymerase sigma factor FliA [Legionellaceae bacterium]|nr:RNA polymerase sigma factor FliA [Legionellaceae bacterium]
MHTDLTAQAEETIFKQHIPLAKRIAYFLSMRLPKTVAFDDLLQAGMLGLLEAIRHYDASKGASFETYASIRIRGYILDEVRHNDWLPRSLYKQARLIAETEHNLENQLGRSPKEHEIAEALGISLLALQDMQKDLSSTSFTPIDDLNGQESAFENFLEEHDNEPDASLVHQDIQNHLHHVIDALPQNERLVLLLYYEHDMNLKDIGDILGVSESRVSQIHSHAEHRVKKLWEKTVGKEVS